LTEHQKARGAARPVPLIVIDHEWHLWLEKTGITDVFMNHRKVDPGQFGVLTDGAILEFADSLLILLMNKKFIRKKKTALKRKQSRMVKMYTLSLSTGKQSRNHVTVSANP
jgi:hypothetical protein